MNEALKEISFLLSVAEAILVNLDSTDNTLQAKRAELVKVIDNTKWRKARIEGWLSITKDLKHPVPDSYFVPSLK